jgi:hypothetical protein
MNLFLIFILILIFFLLITYSPKIGILEPIIFDSEHRIVKYSGFDPTNYLQFVDNIQLMKTTYDETYLYNAIGNLDNLSLNTANSDSDIKEDIQDIIISLGKDGETYIMNHSLDNGKAFRPIYLNIL